MGVFEGKKEVVACPHSDHAAFFGSSSGTHRGFCFSPLYLFTFLINILGLPLWSHLEINQQFI